MNKKIIKSIIKNKLNRWLESIENEEVRNLAKKNTILTGGAIASLLLNEDVKDFDLYFRNKETTLAVANYYVDKFNEKQATKAKVVVEDPNEICDEERIKIVVKSNGVATEAGKEDILARPFEDAVEALSKADSISDKQLEEKEDYRPVFLSSNAITLSNKIQLVVRFYGEPEQIHKNYDFIHCLNYLDMGTGELKLLPEALECLLSKELKYVGSKYPVCSMIRTRKFIKRGFSCNAGNYLKMAMQISALDLTNIQVLEDQLVGVDSAYFMQLIDALKTKQENDPNFKVESTYVASIIDRIF